MMLTMVFLAIGQPRIVKTSVPVSAQSNLDLSFDFADEIKIEYWDKKEVYVEVSVNINDNQHNDIFTLTSTSSESSVSIAMDKDIWDKIDRPKSDYGCNWTTELDYTAFLPKGMTVESYTISGDYNLTYSGSPFELKTISGEIDITVPTSDHVDFKAKTISGEIFSDIDITYPWGKDGLRQIVGQDVKGRIGKGGESIKMETISGNIYLRKG